MDPFLISAATSVASKIIQKISDHSSAGAARSAQPATTIPFSSLINQASAPSPSSIAERTAALTHRLGRSAEVAAVINATGASGPLGLQIEANGNAALHLPGRGLRPVQLSEEMRGVARELYQLRQPSSAASLRNQPPAPLTLALA
jgi:hypothetical protein